MISNFLQLFTKSTLNQRETVQIYETNITGADPGFFLGGGVLVSCSTSTPIKHIVFFFCRIPVVLENRRSSRGGGGGDGAHPLHPPPRSAPVLYCFSCSCMVEIVIILEGNEKEMRSTFKVFNRLHTMVQCICSLFQV